MRFIGLVTLILFSTSSFGSAREGICPHLVMGSMPTYASLQELDQTSKNAMVIRLLKMAFAEPILALAQNVGDLSSGETLVLLRQMESQAGISQPLPTLRAGYEADAEYPGRANIEDIWRARGLLREDIPELSPLLRYMEVIIREPQVMGFTHFPGFKGGTTLLKEFVHLKGWKSGLEDEIIGHRPKETLRLLNSIVTPVSPIYGPEGSRNLIRTTQILIYLIQGVVPLLHKSYSQNSQLIEGEITRLDNSEAPQSTMVRGLIEGIVSLHQSIVFLTALGVPGADTEFEAVKNIILKGASRRGLISQLTAKLPMGLIGPLVVKGAIPNNAVVKTDEGYELSSDFVADLKMDKAIFNSRGVCPVAGCVSTSETGIQLLAEAWFKIYAVVSQNP